MMRASYPRDTIVRLLFLMWAILCLLFYMRFPGKESYVQWSSLASWQLLGAKLARLDPSADLINLLWSFLGMILFSLACTALGAFLAENARIPHLLQPPTALQGSALLATEFLIGNGLFSLVFLALAGLYQLTPAYVILLLLVGACLGARPAKKRIEGIVLKLSSASSEAPKISWSRFALLLSVGILGFSLLFSTARISYDSSALYFSDAKLTALNNHVEFFTEDSFVVSAFQTGIQYTALIEVFGDQSARLFSWFCGGIFILLTLAVAERMGISKPGLSTLFALLVTTTALVDLMGDGKVDILTSAPAMAAVYWVVVDGQSKTSNRTIRILIGFLVGLAIVGRPFNAFLLSIFMGLIYLQRLFFRKGFEPLLPRSFLTSVLSIATGAIGPGIYHLFANWMIQGDPLAFLSSVSSIRPSSGPWDFDPDQILAVRLLYPFIATFQNSPQTLGNISPLFVAFLPVLLIQDIRRRVQLPSQLYALVIAALVTLLLWIFLFFTVYELRYVLFLWAILFIPVAEIIALTLENENRLLRNAAGALVVALLTFTLLRTLYIPLDTYSPIDKNGNPQCFCDSLGPINEAASPGDRVLTLSAYRYYLRTDLFACSTRHDEYRSLRDAAQTGAEAFWSEVYRQGYQYISFEVEYTTKHLRIGIIPGPANAPAWLELQPLYTSPEGTHIAYRIDVRDPPVEVELACETNPKGVWEVQNSK